MTDILSTYDTIQDLSMDPITKDFIEFYNKIIIDDIKLSLDSLYESLVPKLNSESRKLVTGLFTAYQIKTGGYYTDYSWEQIYDLALDACDGNPKGFPYAVFTLLNLNYGSEFNCAGIVSRVSDHLFDFIHLIMEIDFGGEKINFYMAFNKVLLLAYKRNIRDPKLIEVCKYVVKYPLGFDTLTKSNATAYLGQWKVIPDGTLYTFDRKNDLINEFDNVGCISQNYSQAMQDMFILTMTNGLYEGTFLEIGSAYPVYESNTYLLEKWFDWKGVSIDYSDQYQDEWNSIRRDPYIRMNALEVDYRSIINQEFESEWIDYLQVDLDPASMTLDVLKKVMSESPLKFGLITFEHDAYRFGTEVRDEQRKLLESLGYELIVPDVCVLENCPFEDWWRHKDYPIKINPQFRTVGDDKRYVFNQMFYK